MKRKIIIIILILLIPLGLVINANAILVTDGTNAILAQTGLDEILASARARGYDGANFGGMVGGMFVKAGQAFTSSAQGTYIQFQTTPLGSVIPADVFRINTDGSIGVNQKICLDGIDCLGNDYIKSVSNGNNQLVSGGNVITFPNSTGTLALAGGSGAVVNTTTCSGTDKVSAINNVTGVVTCTTDSTGAGMTTMKKTADQTVNAGAAVYTDIIGLSFPVTNGVDYAFHYYIVFRSAATATGFKCSVNGPTGTVDYFMTYQTVANAAAGGAGVATWLQAHQTVYDGGFLNLSTVTANADLVCIIDGRYKSTADGTFTARFANELAANTNIVIQKGSYGWWF